MAKKKSNFRKEWVLVTQKNTCTCNSVNAVHLECKNARTNTNVWTTAKCIHLGCIPLDKLTVRAQRIHFFNGTLFATLSRTKWLDSSLCSVDCGLWLISRIQTKRYLNNLSILILKRIPVLWQTVRTECWEDGRTCDCGRVVPWIGSSIKRGLK